MRVLFINTVFGKGSTGRIVQDIGEVLEKNGHEYVALYGRNPVANNSNAVFIGTPYDAKIHAVLSRLTDKCGFYSKTATVKAIDYIRYYNPDVIHLHNLHGYYINIEQLFQYLRDEYRGKLIWTLHDCWAFTGHCVHYTFAGCAKWKEQCENCPEKKRYPASMLIDNSKANYLAKKKIFAGLKNLTIVTPSEWLASQVRESFLNSYPCMVINNGVDLDVFKPLNHISKKHYVLNVVDGLDERKGFSDLVEISKKLSGFCDVVIIGVNKDDKNNIPKSITALDRTSNQHELAQYYSDAMYLINTTYEDTFPTVNIEALACGTPIITYQSGGSAEMVDSKSGYSVNPGDTDKILSLIREGELLRKEDCRTQALKYNKWDKYKQYLDLYVR